MEGIETEGIKREEEKQEQKEENILLQAICAENVRGRKFAERSFANN